MDHSRLGRLAVLAAVSLLLAVAATVVDAVLGNRIGSQTIAWALGGVLVVMAARGAVARVRISGAASGAVPGAVSGATSAP